MKLKVVHKMTKKNIDRSTKIAPKNGECKFWTVEDWRRAKQDEDWDKMIQMFWDRVNGRYLAFINQMNKQPYSGFAIMTLGCALIETLHQFYKGIKSSNESICDCGHHMNNSDFYIQFLTESSFIFKNHFKNKKHAAAFYNHFRCGLIHQAETKSDSKIRRKKGDLLLEPTKNGLLVYRETFADLLKQEVENYILHLKSNDVPNLRDQFTKKMDYICRVQFED